MLKHCQTTSFWVLTSARELPECKHVMSSTTSRCTALVAHVKRKMYTFLSPFPSRMYIAPVKSAPQTENGVGSLVRTFGSGVWRIRRSIGFSCQSYKCDSSFHYIDSNCWNPVQLMDCCYRTTLSCMMKSLMSGIHKKHGDLVFGRQ